MTKKMMTRIKELSSLSLTELYTRKSLVCLFLCLFTMLRQRCFLL